MSKPPKRIMHSFKLAEISAVDKPAQEGAVATLIKRDNSADVDTSKAHTHPSAVAKDGYTFTPMMTTAEEGHQHIVQVPDGISSGYTDCAKMEGESEYGTYHSHPWIRTDAGLIAIGEADGHTHQMMSASDVAAAATTTTEEDMTAKAAAPEIEKANDAVVYTAVDGTIYHKSDDARLVAMAKDRDESNAKVDALVKAAAEDKAKLHKADLAKRASVAFANLPGSEDVRGELLGAIESIKDEDVRKAAFAAVKAGSDSLAAAFKRSGSNDAVVGGTADSMFKSALATFAKQSSRSEVAATADFLRTQEGAELYALVAAERNV